MKKAARGPHRAAEHPDGLRGDNRSSGRASTCGPLQSGQQAGPHDDESTPLLRSRSFGQQAWRTVVERAATPTNTVFLSPSRIRQCLQHFIEGGRSASGSFLAFPPSHPAQEKPMLYSPSERYPCGEGFLYSTRTSLLSLLSRRKP